MGYFLHPLRFLVAKVETTPGTAIALTDADFDVKIRNPEITPTIEMDDEASKWARGDHGEDESISGAQSAQITFSVRMTKGSSVSTQPAWWKFMQACGQKPVAYTTTGVALQPLKEYDVKPITIKVFDIERGGATPGCAVYTFAGCMGNVVMSAEGVGKPDTATFTFTGKLVSIDTDEPNASILNAVITETTCAEKFLQNTACIGATGELISGWSLDVGNEIQPVIDQTDSTGYAYFAITNRKPRLTMNPLVSTHRNFWNDLAYGVTGCPASHAMHIGSTGLGRLAVLVPRGQIISAGLANREGLVNWDLTVKCQANGVTGAVSDSALPNEVTFELLQGTRS